MKMAMNSNRGKRALDEGACNGLEWEMRLRRCRDDRTDEDCLGERMVIVKEWGMGIV